MTYRDLFSHADMLSDIYESRRSWAGDPTWKGISWFTAENDSGGEDNENTAITGVDAVMSCHLKETNLSLFVPFPLIPSLPSSLVFFHWFEKEWQRKWELETFSKEQVHWSNGFNSPGCCQSRAKNQTLHSSLYMGGRNPRTRGIFSSVFQKTSRQLVRKSMEPGIKRELQ